MEMMAVIIITYLLRYSNKNDYNLNECTFWVIYIKATKYYIYEIKDFEFCFTIYYFCHKQQDFNN